MCTKILTSQEWQTIYIREHKTIFIPEEPPTMQQAIIWLGKLGGFMNRKNDKLPGTMTHGGATKILQKVSKYYLYFSPRIVGKSKDKAIG